MVLMLSVPAKLNKLRSPDFLECSLKFFLPNFSKPNRTERQTQDEKAYVTFKSHSERLQAYTYLPIKYKYISLISGTIYPFF